MYKIKLPNFEGPFDLLLYFIKRDELSIYDIPISKIAFEFLNYIKLMNLFDIELAGEFIVMAANLIYIKAKMLLPRQISDESGLEDDPRTSIVQNILEYKRFKEVAVKLGLKAEEQRYLLYKQNFDAEIAQAKLNIEHKNAKVYDLLKAFGIALNRNLIKEPLHIVEMFTTTVEEKILDITERLKNNKRFTFSQLICEQNKYNVIVTFLAVLELMKNGTIFITQNNAFDEIIISEVPFEDKIENYFFPQK